ncbi:MAG: histidinol-phosphate transaminase [Pseudanabaenaceae cyanobacterium bins.68]|nr:histidinol-phosphate transaminase [Pseudanabaenaceae cyanobacterium bins.68]
MLPFLRSDLEQLPAYHQEEIDLSRGKIKLDANELSIDLPPWFKQKLADLVAEQIAGNRYPDGAYLTLKSAIATYVGNQIHPDQITLGNGSDELIRSLLMISGLGRGKVLVANPTFSMYAILAQGLGIEVVSVRRQDDFSADLQAATQVLDQVSAVFMVHPNSPTGNLLSPTEIAWLSELPSHILVVIDEAYFEFSGSSLVEYLAKHPNWVILRTFSKAFRLAAYRIGYAIASPEVIAQLEKIRLPYNLPIISSQAALLALQHHQELLEPIAQIQAERESLYQALRQINLEIYPSAGNYLYLRTGRDQEIKQGMAAQGTYIRQTGGGLRITVGTPIENALTLRRLQALL